MDEDETNHYSKNDFLSQSYSQGIKRVTGNREGIPFDFKVPREVIEERERSWSDFFNTFMEEIPNEIEFDLGMLRIRGENDKEDNNNGEVHHRVPTKKPLRDIQYWVDTGNLPYTVADDTTPSENGSTISEDDDNVPLSPDKTKTGVSKRKEPQIEKSSSSSSVDTAVYIKSNTNVTKKLETQALVEGSKATKDKSSKKEKIQENLTNNNSFNTVSKNCKSFENEQSEEAVDKNSKTSFPNEEEVFKNNNTTIETNCKRHEEMDSNEEDLFPKFNSFRKSVTKRKLFTGRNSPVELIYPTQISQSPTKKRRASIHPALDPAWYERSKKVHRRRTMKRSRLAAAIPEENSSPTDNLAKEVSFMKSLGLSPRNKPINELNLQPVVRLERLSDNYVNSICRKNRPKFAGPREIISEDNSESCESDQSTILIYKCNNTAESDFSLSENSFVDVEHFTGDEKEEGEQKKVQSETEGEEKIIENYKTKVSGKKAKGTSKPRFQIRRKGGKRNSLKMKRSFNHSKIPVVLLERLPSIKPETLTSPENIDEAEAQNRRSRTSSSDVRNQISKPSKIVENSEGPSTHGKTNSVGDSEGSEQGSFLLKKPWPRKSNIPNTVSKGTVERKFNKDKRSTSKLVSSDEEDGLLSLLKKQMEKKEELTKHESSREQSPTLNRRDFGSNKSPRRPTNFHKSSSTHNVRVVSSSSSSESDPLEIKQKRSSSIRNRASTRSRRPDERFDKESSPVMNSKILKRKKRISALKRRNNASQEEECGSNEVDRTFEDSNANHETRQFCFNRSSDKAGNLSDVESADIPKESSVIFQSKDKSKEALISLKGKGRNAGSNNLGTCSKVVSNDSDVESLIFTTRRSVNSQKLQENLSEKNDEGNISRNNKKVTDCVKNFGSWITESVDEFPTRSLSNSSSSGLSIFDSRKKNTSTRKTSEEKLQQKSESNRTETTLPKVSIEIECSEEPKEKVASIEEGPASQWNSENNEERLASKERRNGTMLPNFEKNDYNKRLRNRLKRQPSKSLDSSSSDSDSSILLFSRGKSKIILDKEDRNKNNAMRTPTKKVGGLNNVKTVNKLARNNSARTKPTPSFAKEDSASDSVTFSKKQIPKEEKMIKQNVGSSSQSRVGFKSKESSNRTKLKLFSSSSEDDESVFWAIVQKGSKKVNKTDNNSRGEEMKNPTNSSIGNSSKVPVYRATKIVDSDSDESM